VSEQPEAEQERGPDDDIDAVDSADGAGPAEDAGATDGADPRVAAAVARLDRLGDTPPAEHVEVYEDVHRVLQDALADAARGQEPAAPGQPVGPRQ
jgi:hypothetical protein